MEIIKRFEIAPFKSIHFALKVLRRYELLGAKFQTDRDFEGDTRFDNLLNWLVLSKAIKTIYLKHDKLTIYDVTAKTVEEDREGIITFQVTQNDNTINIYSNIQWNNEGGAPYKLEDIKISETLRGLTNCSRDLFWYKVDRHYFLYAWDDWDWVYFNLREIAKKDTLRI